MKGKLKSAYLLFRTYIFISKYLPRSIFDNHADMPWLLKIISLLRAQKPLPYFQENGSSVMLSTDSVYMERKRKMMVIDEKEKAVLHVFKSLHGVSEYENNRNAFVSSSGSPYFRFPTYACNTDASSHLVVVEEKITGVSLNRCDDDTVGDFLDIWFEVEKRKWKLPQDTEGARFVYDELRRSAYKLEKQLSPDSPFFKLYSECGRPFDEVEGTWPIAFCHGQTVPVNILYSQEDGQYCFIDYEPKLMGCAPYGYDFAFFVLYSDDLISSEYKTKLKTIFSAGCHVQDWKKHFLAQIVWWAKDRALNQRQVKKINKRTLTTLDLSDSRGVSQHG